MYQRVVRYISRSSKYTDAYVYFQNLTTFQVIQPIPLADIFEDLEQMKTNNELAEYTVHQDSLEHIFLTLTEHQTVQTEIY